MITYHYKAIDENGAKKNGQLEAESSEIAASLLLSRGYIPSRISEESKSASGNFLDYIKSCFNPIKTSELILFTKQFKTLFKAGVSIRQLLLILETQTENLKLKKILGDISRGINNGSSLEEAMGRHPKVFSSLYLSMVEAGTVSGSLPAVLERLTHILEHEHKMKSDIKAAIQYPVFVMSFLIVAFIVLLTFVIPKFSKVFLNSGIDLPLPTLICIGLNHFLSTYWYLILGGVIIACVSLYLSLKNKKGRFFLDTFLLKLPVIGSLLTKAAMARFASIGAILQASGISILESMKILSGVIGNAAIEHQFVKISENLREGKGIAVPLKEAGYFPPMLVNMVAIGEESGNLDEMLNEVAIHYDAEVEFSMKQMSDAIGPILTVGLACVIGFFALAIFLPMWDLTQMVK